jgi:ABC-2 type transport system permease protein
MSTIAATAPAAGVADRTPRRGLVSLTYLQVELRRLVRNRRTVIFSLVMPPVFFLLFGTAKEYRTESVGHANVTAWIMVSMALYGAMLATTSGGASVSLERSQGWTRQLRLTPLRPASYVLTKVVAAMVLGLASVVVTAAVGLAKGASGDAGRIALAVGLAWVCSAVFAAFGLFMGYLLPSENVMQVLGPVLALLAFAGGLFVPLGDGLFATIAKFVPTYGVAQLARWPLTGTGGGSDIDPGNLALAVLNVAVWAVVFTVGAAWRFRKDTARV